MEQVVYFIVWLLAKTPDGQWTEDSGIKSFILQKDCDTASEVFTTKHNQEPQPCIPIARDSYRYLMEHNAEYYDGKEWKICSGWLGRREFDTGRCRKGPNE